jgi:hypothetical protein
MLLFLASGVLMSEPLPGAPSNTNISAELSAWFETPFWPFIFIGLLFPLGAFFGSKLRFSRTSQPGGGAAL